MTTCAPMPIKMDEVQCTTVQGRVYVQEATEPDASDDCEYTIYCYDPASNSWNHLPILPVKYCGLGTFNNQLVVVGGITCDNHISDKVFTFQDNRWNDNILPALEKARHSNCVLSFSCQLVVAGGKAKPDAQQNSIKDINYNTCYVEIYDKDKHKWFGTIPLPKACHLSSIVIENKAFVIGRANSKLVYFVSSEDLENGKEDYDDDGMDDTKSIGSLPTWRALRETPMEVPGAATLGGNLLTVGGRTL